MEISCPKCGQPGRVADSLIGKKISCDKCDQVFVAEANRPSQASGDPASQNPARGSIECPYCDSVVVQVAKLMGQTILCPKCHAQFKAPQLGASAIHMEGIGQRRRRMDPLRIVGLLLLVTACILGIKSLSMDTSVAVERQVNGWTHVERVNNLGLMDDRRNWLIVSGFAAMIGALFFGIGILGEKRADRTKVAFNAQAADANPSRP